MFFGIAGFAFYFFDVDPPTIIVKDAELVPMGRGYALVATIKNEGNADRLTGFGSEAVAQTRFMGAGSLVIPAGGTPALAMDGAHGMVMGIHGDTDTGRVVPMVLWFQEAGRITARARISAPMRMDHGERITVDAAEAPVVEMVVEPEKDGWRVTLNTQNFSFSQDGADGPHVAGQGHGHLYLNGLKLQRMYTETAQIGALPSGTYDVTVSLNTNDHRVYATNGKAISASVALVVP